MGSNVREVGFCLSQGEFKLLLSEINQWNCTGLVVEGYICLEICMPTDHCQFGIVTVTTGTKLLGKPDN